MKKLISALLVSSLAMPALAQNTFHGNVARTGVFQGGAPAKVPAIKWSFKTGGPIVGSAAVADGIVYIASLSSYLYAIDQQSGEKKWEFKSRMPIASSPAIADGLVYFVSSTGALAAIDAKTGQPAWVISTVTTKPSKSWGSEPSIGSEAAAFSCRLPKSRRSEAS